MPRTIGTLSEKDLGAFWGPIPRTAARDLACWTWSEIESALLRIDQKHWSTNLRAGLSTEDGEVYMREGIARDLKRELAACDHHRADSGPLPPG